MIQWFQYQPLGGLTPGETTGTVNGTVVLTAGTALIGKAPTAGHGGGITISEAIAHVKAGTVASLTLYDMGTGGTAVAGTICTISGTFANAPNIGTPSDYFLSAGKYIALAWGVGTCTLGPNNVFVGYKMGRSGS